MVSRFSNDIGSSESDARRSENTDYVGDDSQFIVRSQLNEVSLKGQDPTESELEEDKSASVMQMALIQLMTQKVLEATANCPEALKQMNSKIRSQKK